MKKLLLFIALLLLNSSVFGQAPEKFKYQAIITDNEDKPIKNKTIGLEISIMQNDVNGNLSYQEAFTPTTNKSGMVSLEIGTGNVTSGVFSEIDWSVGPYFLSVAVDKNGGTNYIFMGASQLLSVPYALYAKKAQSVEGDNDTDPTNEIELPETANENDVLTFNGSEWVALSVSNNIDLSNFEQGDILQFDGNNLKPAIFSFYYQDKDLDGYGNNNGFIYSPIQPTGFIITGGDSDDNDPNINPDATEVCRDGIDNNSDGQIDEGCDVDNDGFTTEEGDCDDNDATVKPGAPELCDGKDNDCDGETDENCDRDNDGFTVDEGDCDDYDPLIFPGAPEVCDDMDNDCDGEVDNHIPVEIVDTNDGSCATAQLIGNVCGDENCISGPSISGIGEGWYKVSLRECDNGLGISRLKFTAKLTNYGAINYDLYLYSSCGELVDSSTQYGTDEEVYVDFADIPLVDDTQYVYLEIRWSSGTDCRNWTLTTKGGCNE